MTRSRKSVLEILVCESSRDGLITPFQHLSIPAFVRRKILRSTNNFSDLAYLGELICSFNSKMCGRNYLYALLTCQISRRKCMEGKKPAKIKRWIDSKQEYYREVEQTERNDTF
jgi:hypothetical protein